MEFSGKISLSKSCRFISCVTTIQSSKKIMGSHLRENLKIRKILCGKVAPSEQLIFAKFVNWSPHLFLLKSIWGGKASTMNGNGSLEVCLTTSLSRKCSHNYACYNSHTMFKVNCRRRYPGNAKHWKNYSSNVLVNRF